MPDFTTHFLLGQHILSKIDTESASIIKANMPAFNWGLQGPDLFFFRKAITGRSSLPEVGHLIHSEKTHELFKAIVELIEQRTDTIDSAPIKSYFYGFIGHYFLDKIMHPYVYYQQQRLKDKQPLTPSSVIHAKIESCLDSQLYRLFCKQSIPHFNLKEHYEIEAETREIIAMSYKKILKVVYSIDVCEKEILACFKDAMFINGILYSSNKFFTDFTIKTVETLMKKPEAFSSHIKRKSCLDDFLNLEGYTWYNLWYPERKYKSTVPELFEQALREAIQVINRISASEDLQAFNDIFGVSFDNGAPKG